MVEREGGKGGVGGRLRFQRLQPTRKTFAFARKRTGIVDVSSLARRKPNCRNGIFCTTSLPLLSLSPSFFLPLWWVLSENVCLTVQTSAATFEQRQTRLLRYVKFFVSPRHVAFSVRRHVQLQARLLQELVSFHRVYRERQILRRRIICSSKQIWWLCLKWT